MRSEQGGSTGSLAVGRLAGIRSAAAHLIACVAEGVADVVAGVGDLVGQALVAVGLPPGLLGLVVDVPHRFLGVGLRVFVAHGIEPPDCTGLGRPFCDGT
jgi:hypothetical protein